MIKLVACNVGGLPVGESHWNCRHPDALVAMAQDMRAAGATYPAIAAVVLADPTTVASWCLGRRRKPAARIIARRVKPTT